MTNEDKIKAFDRLLALLEHHALDSVTISRSYHNPTLYFVEANTISGDRIDGSTDPLAVALAVVYAKTEEYVTERDGDDE
jgi:hypothetical protein